MCIGHPTYDLSLRSARPRAVHLLDMLIVLSVCLQTLGAADSGRYAVDGRGLRHTTTHKPDSLSEKRR